MLFPFVMIRGLWQTVIDVLVSVASTYTWFTRRALPASPTTVDDPTPSPEEQFMTTAKTRFLATPPCCDNIDPLCYRRQERTEALAHPDHPLETIWNTRCMYVNTPRGNVMMRYDAYKEGFAYYCDQTYVPYGILNALAMRYVKLYRCADFFMDETVLMAHGIANPLILAIQDEEKKKEDEKRQHRPAFLGEHHDVFLKRKPTEEAPKAPSAPLESKNATKNNDSNEKKENKDPRTNRFLYRGKLHNMRFLAPPASPTPAGKQPFANSLFQEMFDTKGPVTYKDYKSKL